MKVHPYLNFDGQTEEAFDFYQSAFGGQLSEKMRMGGTPDGGNLSDEEKNRIMHVSLPLGDGIFLMGSDILPSAGHKIQSGNQTYICMDVKSREEADRLFKALSKEGKVEMEMADMFWGAYFGSFEDKFGIRWMINAESNTGSH